jgi:chromate transporter
MGVPVRPVPLRTIAAQWLRIGVIGFGGPPAHIALLRRLCVQQRGWLSDREFEDAIAATNLLPGPASTQLAIYCAWRLAGPAGALLGGACFIVPGLVLILALSVLLLGGHPAAWVLGAAAGAGAAVAPVAVSTAAGLAVPSWRRADGTRAGRARWIGYVVAAAAAAVLVGPWLVLVLLGAGLVEMLARRPKLDGAGAGGGRAVLAVLWPAGAAGSVGALAWTALKVGALSYGGGFVIIPLMRGDAVSHHWMTGEQFLYAVALGQITPGPVVQTVAVVGYAAAGLVGGALAAVLAFAPSFVFVLAGGRHFDRLRADQRVQGFLAGAGPAAIGAIAGSAVPLALSLSHGWQVPILALAAGWLALRRGAVVPALLGAAVLGALAALAGFPVG